MREILFRGKRIFDNGQWVEGFLLKVTLDGETWHLIFGDDFQRSGLGITAMQHAAVNPSTVGQYTGLKDKNGKRIFEGDELSWHNGSGAVNFGGGCFCVRLHGEIECYGRNNPAIDVIFNLYPELEVIGNIHDKPEPPKEDA